MKKVIALAVLVIVVGSVIVAGAKDADPQKDWQEMCGKANGLIWDAVCELLDRVIALEGNLGTLDTKVNKEVASLVTADDGLSSDITTLDTKVNKEVASLVTADDGLSLRISALEKLVLTLENGPD